MLEDLEALSLAGWVGWRACPTKGPEGQKLVQGQVGESDFSSHVFFFFFF